MRQAQAGCEIPVLRAAIRASAMMPKTEAMNKSLSDLDPDIEKEQRDGNRRLRQAHFIQCAGKAKAMQQAEGERDNPGKFLCQPRPALTAVNDFRRHEHDAQRDGGFDRWPRHMDESKRRTRKRQAVREGECR